MSQLPLVVRTNPLPPAKSDVGALELQGHGSVNVCRIVDIPGGDCVATASGDYVIRVHDSQTGKVLRQLRGHTNSISGLAVIGENLIASGQWSGGDAMRASFFVWNVEGGNDRRYHNDMPLFALSTLRVPPSVSVCAIVSLGEGRLAMCPEGDIVIMHHQNGRNLTEEKRLQSAHKGLINDISCFGERIATASEDNTVGLWEAQTLTPVAKLEGHSDGVYDVVLTDLFVISASRDRSLRLYDSHSFSCFRVVEEAHAGWVRGVALVNERHAVSFSFDKTACVINLDTGTVVERLKTDVVAFHGAVFKDGRVAFTGQNGKAIIFDPPQELAASHLFRAGAATRHRLEKHVVDDAGNGAGTALLEFERSCTTSSNKMALFSMTAALAAIPFDGGASAVMQGVAVLLQAISKVKRNLELMSFVPLAAEGLKRKVEGLKFCLSRLKEAPNASPFLFDHVKYTGQVLDDTCRTVDEVESELSGIRGEGGRRVRRKVTLLFGRRQKKCIEKLGTLADRVQMIQDELGMYITVDTNSILRAGLADCQDLSSGKYSQFVTGISFSERDATLRGMQAIAAAASGAFGDVRLLLLALKMLIHDVTRSRSGIEEVFGKLESLSLVDVVALSGDGGTSKVHAGLPVGVDDNEVLSLREELREPVESLIVEIASAGDEVIPRDERMLAVEILGSMWQPWRSVCRKDLKKGERLGSGTSGSVYSAKWTPGGGDSEPLLVAIKCIDIHGGAAQRRRQVSSIEMEAGVMRDCKHACVVRSYGLFVPECRDTSVADNGVARSRPSDFASSSIPSCSGPAMKVTLSQGVAEEGIIVMESMSCNVAKAMEDNVLSSERDIILVLRDVAEGIAYLHSRGVAHLDLKPENILLNLELQWGDGSPELVVVGHAKVADFGTSRRAKEDTVQWVLSGGVGTGSFMAPEMLKEDQPTATASCDVFSFGVMICALLASREAFEEYQTHRIPKRTRLASACSLSGLLAPSSGSIADGRLREVCLACAKDRPEDRPGSRQVRNAMVAIVQNLAVDEVRKCLLI